MAKSNLSDFSCISILELPTWVKVLKASEDINTPLEMLQELTLIDDLLVIMKSQSLLRRKRGLKEQLDLRIAYELGFVKNGSAKSNK